MSVCPRDGAPVVPGGHEPPRVGARHSPPRWDDRTDLASPPPELIGAMLGEYRVEAQIGSGGMGLVYRAVQPVIGKTVAIKVLRKEVSRDPAHVERLLAEARAVNATRHRAIIDIFNFGTLDDGRQYLVMEYLDGRGLDAMLAEKGLLPLPQVMAFARDLASALAAAHAAGVVHRDLKPSNVFVVKQGGVQYVKLLDFGLAERRVDAPSRSGEPSAMIMGTPEYMAPEQARGEEALPQTDLYSLGVMIFEMITGRLPFEAKSPMEYLVHHVKTPPPDVRTLKPGTPPELAELILRMMAKDPQARPASADEVRSVIKEVLAASGIASRKTGERAALTGASGEKLRPRASGERPRLGSEPAPRASGERARLAVARSGERTARKPVEREDVAPTATMPPVTSLMDERPDPRRIPVLRYLAILGGVIAAIALAWFAAGVVDRMLGPAAPVTPAPSPQARPGAAAIPSRAAQEEAETRPRSRATKEPGKLTLVTSPEATVRTKARVLGKTPLFSVPLEAGLHHLELTGADGRTRALSVPIEAGKTAKFRLRLDELPEAE